MVGAIVGPVYVPPASGAHRAGAGTGGTGGGFGAALSALNGLQNQASSAASAVANGGSSANLVGAITSAEQAGVALALAAQVRDTALQAYQAISQVP